MHVTADADELLRAFTVANACSAAAYEDVDIDVRELVGETDPVAVVFALSVQVRALFLLMPPPQARGLLASWGEVAGRTVADRQARGGTPRPPDDEHDPQ